MCHVSGDMLSYYLYLSFVYGAVHLEAAKCVQSQLKPK